MTKINSPAESPNSQTLLNQIVIEYMHEQKHKRVWRWVKRGVMLLVILFGLYVFLSVRAEDMGLRALPHVGLIELKGTIFDNQSASSDNFIKGLDKAYENKELKAIILRIDSPGGSPVQADCQESRCVAGNSQGRFARRGRRTARAWEGECRFPAL